MYFSQAKSIATGLPSDVLRGGDPVVEGRKAREALTLHNLSQQYLEVHAVPKKRSESFSPLSLSLAYL